MNVNEVTVLPFETQRRAWGVWHVSHWCAGKRSATTFEVGWRGLVHSVCLFLKCKYSRSISGSQPDDAECSVVKRCTVEDHFRVSPPFGHNHVTKLKGSDNHKMQSKTRGEGFLAFLLFFI